MAIKISGSTIIDDSRNIVNAGVITATSFSGDGSNLTGVVGIGSTGDINTTGIITATKFSAQKFVGTGDKLIFSPSITSFSPTDGATNVAISTDIVLTFDQLIYAGVGSIFLRNSSGIGTVIEAIGISSSMINNQTLTINPSSDLPLATDVYVVLPQGVIVNSVGGNISSVSTYNFTTSAVPPLGGAYEGGFLICQASSVRWIVAPDTSQVCRNWYSRGDSNTRAQQVSGCTGWFVPTCGQLKNPGFTCRTYWDSYCFVYWSDTDSTPTNTYLIGFDGPNGTVGAATKTTACFVRSFRCVTY